MKRIFRNISLIMCTITLTFVGCKNKLETVNNDSNNNETESELISGSINGHDYIDLGLPSGTKWATCNVGANIPEEYGYYYAQWDETITKSEYTEYNIIPYGYYNLDYIRGNPNYDVARKWGGSWRLPTREEIIELMENCTWKWTTQNNVNGCKVTGPNGNSIFLPAAGGLSGELVTSAAGICGCYYSSTPSRDTWIWGFDFSSCNRNITECTIDGPRSVRPVSD